MDLPHYPHASRLCRAVRRALRSPVNATLAGALAFALPAIPAIEAAPFPAEFELSSLMPTNGGDGSDGFVIAGASSSDEAGYSVARAGDVNGDDVDDVAVGAWLTSFSGRSRAGMAWIVFGRAGPFSPVLRLADLLAANGGDGSAGFGLLGEEHTDAGVAVSGGDINGDGLTDVLVGAPRGKPADGRTYAGHTHVIYGRPAYPPVVDLKPLKGSDGSIGFTLRGIRGASGSALSAFGDVNGDGLHDILIGAPNAATQNDLVNMGQTYLVYGRVDGFDPLTDLSDLFPANGGDGTAGTVFEGRGPQGFSGVSVDIAGDINGDGLDDFVIGAPGVDFYHGEAYVVFGRADGYPPRFPFEFLLPDGGGTGAAGFVLRNEDFSGTLGYSVSGAGDVNGDGIDDLAIASRSTPATGYVVFGRATGFPPVFVVNALHPNQGGDGTEGFLFVTSEDEGPGTRVAGVGDINDDGVDDLLVGFHLASVGDRSSAGRCYVVYGRTTPFAPAFPLKSLLASRGGDGTLGFVLNGDDEHDTTCRAASGAGDVNADGVADLLIGAEGAEIERKDGVERNTGFAYVVFGRAAGAR
jgi:hypothetical protein